MTKVHVKSTLNTIGGTSEPFLGIPAGLNIINQSADGDQIYIQGDVILGLDKVWHRGAIWYDGNFNYDSKGRVDGVVNKIVTQREDGSSSIWLEEINFRWADIENAGRSENEFKEFLNKVYSGDDKITNDGGGSITANLYTGNDNIEISSGNNNDINGGSGNDTILINSEASGFFFGGDDNDSISSHSDTAVANGGKGVDILTGLSGNNILRGGNGGDVMKGGSGGDELYGGFGMNTFTGERGDGYVDSIYIKSDHLLYNHLYDKANNNPNGIKADKIGALDSFDRIYIQGAKTSQLSFGYLSEHIRADKEVIINGIGIYADGALEAVYAGGSYTLGLDDIKAMTFGIPD